MSRTMETMVLLVVVIAGAATAGALAYPWTLAAAMVVGIACGRIVRIVERAS